MTAQNLGFTVDCASGDHTGSKPLTTTAGPGDQPNLAAAPAIPIGIALAEPIPRYVYHHAPNITFTWQLGDPDLVPDLVAPDPTHSESASTQAATTASVRLVS